jgi:hypothetical protein
MRKREWPFCKQLFKSLLVALELLPSNLKMARSVKTIVAMVMVKKSRKG